MAWRACRWRVLCLNLSVGLIQLKELFDRSERLEGAGKREGA